MPRFPANHLDPAAQPWVRDVQGRLESVEQALTRRAEGELNTRKGSTSDFRSLANQVRETRAIVDKLVTVSTATVAESSTGVTGFSGFYTGARPSLRIASPTGRLALDFGGSLNSGTGYFVYSIVGDESGVIVDRAVMQSNPARRIAVSGGSSFAPSGYRSSYESVPIGETVTVTLEFFATDTFTYFFGGSISARPAL